MDSLKLLLSKTTQPVVMGFSKCVSKLCRASTIAERATVQSTGCQSNYLGHLVTRDHRAQMLCACFFFLFYTSERTGYLHFSQLVSTEIRPILFKLCSMCAFSWLGDLGYEEECLLRQMLLSDSSAQYGNVLVELRVTKSSACMGH